MFDHEVLPEFMKHIPSSLWAIIVHKFVTQRQIFVGAYAEGGYNTSQTELRDTQKLVVSPKQHKSSIPWSEK